MVMNAEWRALQIGAHMIGGPLNGYKAAALMLVFVPDREPYIQGPSNRQARHEICSVKASKEGPVY